MRGEAITRKTIRPTEPELERKLNACRAALRRAGRIVVAFSGGVDSSFLLALAVETLGTENVLAAMAVSTIFPQRERCSGRRIARKIGVELVEIETPQLADPSFAANPADRCFYCKLILLGELKAVAARRGFSTVATGANASAIGQP